MKKILILAGGYSKEKEISIKTAKSVFRELNKDKKYNIKVVNPDGKFVEVLRKFKPNSVLNLLHGRYGEDGYIQAILESEKIKYTHSGVLSSSIAIDKELSKKIFIKNNILVPKYFLYGFDKSKSELIKLINKKVKFPVVLKPINEGSSVNVFICNKSNIFKKIELLKDYKKIIVEEFISGREIQAAIIGSKKLGAIELKPKRKFYDFEAKYNFKARTEHIIPVDLNRREYTRLMSIAFKAHKLIKCGGVTRSDFKFYKGKFYLLEINTQPGMTSISLVPEIAAHNGISFIKLIELILKNASKKKVKKF